MLGTPPAASPTFLPTGRMLLVHQAECMSLTPCNVWSLQEPTRFLCEIPPAPRKAQLPWERTRSALDGGNSNFGVSGTGGHRMFRSAAYLPHSGVFHCTVIKSRCNQLAASLLSFVLTQLVLSLSMRHSPYTEGTLGTLGGGQEHPPVITRYIPRKVS